MVHTGFNWKLCVTIFLLLETVVVGSLKPRVYKKFADTKVEIAAKTFLVAVLVVGLYSDSLSSVLAEGDAIPADNAYCKNFPASGGGPFGVNCAEVDACVLQDDLQCVPRPITVQISLFMHLVYGLPGVAPFFLSKICNRRKSCKKKKKPKNTSPDVPEVLGSSEKPPETGTFVTRAQFAPSAEPDESDVSRPAEEQSAPGFCEPGWRRNWSADHNRPYWTDVVSGQSTWLEPQRSGEEDNTQRTSAAPAPTPAVAAAASTDWEEDYSEEYSRAYWRNVVTRETTWERPQALTQVHSV
jgi:hypothetical protein